MAIVTTDNQHYADIAAAIRAKNGSDAQYTPPEMAAAIQAIQTGSGETLQIVSGSFIPAEDTLIYTVQHNLGRIPRIVCFFYTNEDIFSVGNPAAHFAISADFFPNGSTLFATRIFSQYRLRRPDYYEDLGAGYFSGITEAELTIGNNALSSDYWTMLAGEEYFWFAVG